MNEPFILELNYKNQTLELHAAFQRYGFIYRIAVVIDQMTYLFEPDEEGNYRVLSANNASNPPDPDVELLRTIAERLLKLT